MGFDSPSHWLILGLVVLVLFGYKKLPEMSRSVGRSLRIFKTEMKGMTEDDSARDAQPSASPVTPPVLPGTPVAPPSLTKPDEQPEQTAQVPATETSRETPQ
ncbi:MAG TPA: Sec-independent protein translocase subunit TatA [Jatrophihabitans sp.]|jgi:sec-independent protein translocase protein TatA|nr:Sec-independent protein translocase subunit TatA [Jatrophihabitans sp.]